MLVHAVAGPLAMHGLAVELTGEPHREIGDVDHLLHLTFALGEDLAHFACDQGAEVMLMHSQLVGDFTNDLAAPREPAACASGRKVWAE